MSTHRTRRRTQRTPLSALAVAVVAGLIGSLVVSGSANAITRAEVSADPAAWAATPYSPLAWGEVDATANLSALSFDAEAGGLPDSADVGTGFSMVQPSSAAGSAPYYDPAALTLSGGKLRIQATKGIAFKAPPTTGLVNQQDNTLGVGLDATGGKKLYLTTTLAGFPAAAVSSAQAGVWFGPDDANYLKIATVAGTNNRQFQLLKETNNVVTDLSGSATANADQIIFNVPTTTNLTAQPIKLELFLDPAARTATGVVTVGTGAAQTIGTLTGVPANFFDGTLVTSRPADSTVSSFGGLFTTRRNMADNAPVAFEFEQFGTLELDTTPPSAPASVTAVGTDDTVEVSWGIAEDDNLVGYRVYRSATTPVPVSPATLISGTAPVTTTSFSDSGVFRGSAYYYAVVGVDDVGNVSPSTTSAQSSTTGPVGTPIAAFDFTTPAGTVPAGYTKDSGAPYAAGQGFGWKNSAGTPVDVNGQTRVRAVAGLDPRLDSIIHMEPNTVGTGDLALSPYSWQYDVPNGTYTILAAVGDGAPGANGYDSEHLIRAEGQVVLGPWTANAARPFDEAVRADIVVTDGNIVIDQVGGNNTKLAYVEVYRTALEQPAAPTGLATSVAGEDVSLSWATVPNAASYKVFRGATADVSTSGSPLATVETPAFADLTTEYGNTYHYVVVATTAQGVDSAASASAPAVIPQLEEPDPGVLCTTAQWTAEYFEGVNLGTTPVSVSCQNTIDQSYPSGVTPGFEGAVNGETYSIRWTKTINQGAGSYAIKTRTDDGVRVRIDGNLVVNRWFAQSGDSTVTQQITLGEGSHEVVVEYYQSFGTAQAHVSIQKVATDCDADQWRYEYFAGTELAGSVVSDGCVSSIDRSFDAGQAPAGLADELGSDLYSTRWTKTINEGRGTYTFTAKTDDGVRIFVDGARILNEWYDQSADETHTAEVTLSTGPHLVVVEYYQGYNEASAKVSYERTSFDAQAPDAPTGLAAQAGAASIKLNWTASVSTDVAGYRVYRSETTPVATTGAALSGATALTATTYTDTTAVPGTTYYYAVVAVDTSDNVSAGSASVPSLISTAPDTEAPAPATGLIATAGNASVALTWTAPAAADLAGYRVYRGVEPAVAITSANLVSGSALIVPASFTDPTVTNGTTYFYVVVAVDLAGNVSAASNEVVAVPLVPNTTNVKVDFTATDAVPAAGYLADWGQPFGVRSGAAQGSGAFSYGWLNADGNTASLVTNGRDRGRTGVPELLDSFIHMQYGDVDNGNGTNGVKIDGVWELAVPDGLYEVTVAVGDQPNANTGYDSEHVINVEGSVGIERFVGSAAAEYRTVTTSVGVWDGKLTIDAADGLNTKLAYIDVKGVPRAPHVDTVLPENRVVGHDVNAGVSATIKVPYAGVGLNPLSLPGNVHLYNAATGVEVPTTVGSSGGNDVISLAPDDSLAPNTQYRFVVGTGVTDNFGVHFLPFTSLFTTGSGETTSNGEFTPVTGVGFEKVELPSAAGKHWASFAFGPDGKLYATSIGEGLWRFPVNADGTLGTGQNLGYEGVAQIGLLFDKSSTASDLRVWVTRTTANFSEQGQWVSSIHQLSGPDLGTDRLIFEGLPRSLSDHLTNSMAYGPDGRIYFQQGSNQASGDLDNSWGQRGEQLLTASTLVFDPANGQIQTAANGGASINVKTADGGSYNPYAATAPLKIYASGIRNAYDLVWHSNGHLYVATNGTAGGANTPGVTANANGTFTRTAAPGIPGYSTVNGRDVTAQCVRRGYTGGTVAPQGNIATQRDLLFDVVAGGYYGHPNPERCEFALNAGNNPASGFAPIDPTKYAAGTNPDPNYRGIAYNFEFNKSPNGSIEYKSSTFGGQLKGRLVVVRFSNNNDLLFLQPDAATGKILGAQTSVGITGVANSTIGGVDGFNDPLEVVEDPSTGNLYVNQYDRSGNDQRTYLLRVPSNQQAAAITPSASELVFSGTKSNSPNGTIAPRTRTVTLTNNKAEPVQLTSALSGAQAAEFQITGGTATIPAKGQVTVTLAFKPSTAIGQRSAVATFTAGGASTTVGLFGLTMNGIEGGNEPTFVDVLGTLGYKINPGWTGLAGGVEPVAKGDEVLEPLFVKSGTAPVSMTPLAHYAPDEELPFGWYTGNGVGGDRHQLGSVDGKVGAGYQSLLPPTTAGTVAGFDPGAATFGFYYYSNEFGRTGFTEDRLNDSNGLHRARIYPAKNRAGVLLTGSYVVAFEDASNGDYQDYVFLVTGVKPVTDTGSVDGAIKIDFTSAAGDLAAGYLRDFGQAYGPRSAADQGSGLSFGWKDATTENDVDLSTGGTAGNGRDRATTQPDVRLDSFMHMQPSTLTGFNGNPTDAYWQMALPNGQYQVTVAVGDPAPQTQPEVHQINLEHQPLINLFTPSGTSGSSTRHRTGSALVTVADGFLTVDAIGGTNTKISYIDIVPFTGTTPGGGDDPTDGAQVKINFQPVAAPTPSGWTADTGAAYTAGTGYGWTTPAGAPVDHTEATRYRTGPMSGISFPTDPLLQTYAFLQTNPGPALWEYKLPNGTYEVALSVGDANYLDSVHTVTAEGQPVVSTFTPTAGTPFQTGKRTVTVTDGKLTLAGTGTNTKINWVSIKGDALTPGETQPTVKINYQPAEVATPTGWQPDTGAGYTAARGYGWLVDGIASDRTTATRNRTSATGGITFPTGDVTRQTLILAQSGAVDGVSDGVWEYSLANGTYTVSVSVGDAGYLDSVHGVRAESTPLITGFTPTGGTPFASGTAQVQVTDGKLTLTPTGDNTKLNWVTIAGENLAAPSIAVTANGNLIGTDYSGGTAQVTLAATASGSATITSLTYSLNGGAAQPYTAPLTLATPGTQALQITAKDSEGRTSIRTVSFVVENIGGTVTLRNEQATRVNGVAVPGFSENALSMQRINSGVTAHLTIDQATVTVTNTGAKDLKISSLSIVGGQAAQFQLVNPPVAPLLIAPGASQALTVKFVATSGTKGVRTATLAIASSDPTSPVTNVTLRGGYMTAPEGNSELTLQQISNLFGYTTDIGDLQNGDEMRTSALDGDEVRSLLWKRMDSAKPVAVRQLAAFHGCCDATEQITVNGTSARHSAPYGQSILPLTTAGAATQFTTNPTANFGIQIAGQTTNNANYMAIKTWPVIDQAGKVVPGSWIVGHDYISSPNQCGISPTNCDFQDNVYLVTNILPVASSDTAAPSAPAGVTAQISGTSVDLSWTANAAVEDVAGYHVERATAAAGPWARLTTGTPNSSTKFTDTTVPYTDSAYYRVIAVDASGNVSSPSSAVTVDLTQIPNRAIRFHAGTAPLTTGGVTWLADTPYAAGGSLYTNPGVTQIAGTTDDALYFTERSDVPSFGYNVALPSGTYQVKLHYAEIYWGATGGGAAGSGRRVFNVNFEGGANEITGLDLFARAGAMTAYSTTNSVVVTDGNLDIDFAATTNYPAIQAVEIIRTGDAPVAPAPAASVTGAVSGQDVVLGWTASTGPGLTGYIVERATAAAGPYVAVSGTAPISGTAFTDTSVPVASNVYYRIVAVGAGGLTAAPSNVATVAVGALYTATGLTATVGTSSVAVAWTAATGRGIAGYTVERATAAAGPWTSLTGSTPVTGTAYTDAAVPLVSTVYYRVTAVGASGATGTPTAAVSANVSGLQQDIRINAGGPTLTTGGNTWQADAYFTGGKSFNNAQVTAIAGTTDDVLYRTERSASTDLAGFGYDIPVPTGTYTVRLHFAEIYFGATGGGAGGTGKRVFSANLEGGAVEVANLDLNARVAPMTAYITTNVLNVTDGNLDIDFTSSVNQAKVSGIEILRGGTVTPPAPSVPTGVTGAVSGASNVVTWSAAANATGYHVERATAAAGPWTRLTGSTAVTGTTYTDAAGSTFPSALYRVVAVNSAGVASAASATVTVTRPVTPPAPAVPTGVTGAVSGTSNVVTWSAAANATGYHVERATAAAGPWTRLTGSTAVAPTTYTDAAGSTLPTALYRVIAVNSAGVLSAASATVTVNRPTTPAQQPVRINTGGAAVTVGGVGYLADTYFSGGKTYSNPQVTQIAGTTNDALYLNERSATANLGTFGYNVPVVNGSYTVILHFAELFHGAPGGGAGGAGKRVFSVNLEGGPNEISNLDLNALVAPGTAYTQSRQITVTDGNLDIDFSATVDQPTIGAIEVVPGTVVTPPAAPSVPTSVSAAASGGANVVSWGAASGAVGYHVERATTAAGTWTRLTGTTALTATTFSDAAGSTFPTAIYRVVSVNSAGATSAPSSTATVSRPTTPVQQPIRINSGGPAVTAAGVSWTADAYYGTSGKAYTNPQVTQIANTTADALFLNERSATTDKGSYSYDVPIANGTYTVVLHHAEIYHGATGGGPAGAGKRVFSVNFEGGAVEVTGRDVFVLAGGAMRAYRSSHNVTVTGGNLDIDFAATLDQPTISAIEILPGANATSALATAATLSAPPASGSVPPPSSAPLGSALTGTSSPAGFTASRTLAIASSSTSVGMLSLPTLSASFPQSGRLVEPGFPDSPAASVAATEMQSAASSSAPWQFPFRADFLGLTALLLLLSAVVIARRTGLPRQLAQQLTRSSLTIRAQGRP